MIKQELINLINAYNRYISLERNDEAKSYLLEIPNMMTNTLNILGYSVISKICFFEILHMFVNEETAASTVYEEKLLAFTLGLSDINIYKSDITKYKLKCTDTERIYDCLYRARDDSIVFDISNPDEFVYDRKKLVQAFIKEGIIQKEVSSDLLAVAAKVLPEENDNSCIQLRL